MYKLCTIENTAAPCGAGIYNARPAFCRAGVRMKDSRGSYAGDALLLGRGGGGGCFFADVCQHGVISLYVNDE